MYQPVGCSASHVRNPTSSLRNCSIESSSPTAPVGARPASVRRTSFAHHKNQARCALSSKPGPATSTNRSLLQVINRPIVHVVDAGGGRSRSYTHLAISRLPPLPVYLTIGTN